MDFSRDEIFRLTATLLQSRSRAAGEWHEHGGEGRHDPQTRAGTCAAVAQFPSQSLSNEGARHAAKQYCQESASRPASGQTSDDCRGRIRT
jgi:hypothetical protein